jgi:hypothetical protein
MKTVVLDGKKKGLTEYEHVFDRVTRHTDLILVDDAARELDFTFFFSPLTGPLAVNPKRQQSVSIRFEEAPKIAITSNFVLTAQEGSTARRLLITAFSDYYHPKAENLPYAHQCTPEEDLGKQLMGLQYTPDDWNADANFLAWCVAFYLQGHDKISAPLTQLQERQLRAISTEILTDWATIYFADGGGRQNEFVPRQEAFEDFKGTAKSASIWTPHRFVKSLKAFCQLNGWAYNPPEFQTNGRILKSKDGKTVEMLYIQTRGQALKSASELTDVATEIPF